MKAVVFHQPGGPEALHYEEVADPALPDTGVLVRVGACGVNHLDVWVRTGTYPTGLPHIPGTDVAGSVAKAGGAVQGVKEGDRVVVHPVLSCGVCEFCLEGRENRCGSLRMLGVQTDGGYAEFVVVPAGSVLPIPSEMSFEEAAALPVNFATAWNMLVTKAGVKPGDTVLVLAAGSGVGTAALQIARLHGARVIATAGSDEKLKKAEALGADAVVNHYTQDVAEEARKVTGGRGVDVVVEHVGSATWEKSVRSLARGGRLVTCGVTSGSEGKIDLRYVYRNELSVQGVYAFTKAELSRVLGLAGAGALKPVIDRVMPLRDAEEAHRVLEARQHFGKIVLKP